MIPASRLVLAAAAGILLGCQDGPSPQTPNNSADGDGGTTSTSTAKEPTVREPTEKHACGDHGH